MHRDAVDIINQSLCEDIMDGLALNKKPAYISLTTSPCAHHRELAMCYDVCWYNVGRGVCYFVDDSGCVLWR